MCFLNFNVTIKIAILILSEGYYLFGYVKPDKPELKIKEYEYFRAYYCGLCKALGRNCGQISRFSVSYDLTFAALLIASLFEETDTIEPERCVVDPLHKRPIVSRNRFIDYAADMNIILMYWKMHDDWRNDHSISSVCGTIGFHKGFKAAQIRYPDKSAYIADKLDELAALEMAGCKVVDEAAEPFACLLEEVMSYPSDDIVLEQRKLLQGLAYDLGRWIYIVDAYDDIEKDVLTDNYNPLILQFNYKGENINDFKASIKEWVEFNLTYTLSQIKVKYECLIIRRNKPILDNFIYTGLYESMMKVLGNGEKCSER